MKHRQCHYFQAFYNRYGLIGFFCVKQSDTDRNPVDPEGPACKDFVNANFLGGTVDANGKLTPFKEAKSDGT